MTPERMAGLVARWVRFYTRDLPAPVAQRRVDEIAADLHDHVAHERAHGTGEPRIALGIVSRMVRGLPADAAWRGRQAQAAARLSTKEGRMKVGKAVYRSAVRVALGVALILTVPLVATLVTDGEGWSPADFVLAAVLLTTVGVAIELAAKRAGSLAGAVAIGALGVAAAVLGEADDAPGLVLIGILLFVSACALGVRRRAQPDR